MLRFLGRIGVNRETERNNEELSVEWHIRNFFSLSGKGGDYYNSPEFDFSNARWCLTMNTNGDTRNRPSGCVDLDLWRKDQGPPVTIQLTLCITGAEGVEKRGELVCEFTKIKSVWGFESFFPRHVLRDYESLLMPNGVLTVTCIMKSVVPSSARTLLSYQDTTTQTEVESTESSAHTCGSQLLNKQDASIQTDEELTEAEAISEKNHSFEKQDEENLQERGEDSEVPRKMQGLEEMQKSLQNMLRSGDDSDVTIKVQGKEFPAHRALLRARSPVFQAMFTHDMVEKQKGVITMEDCDPDAFPDFLEHVYTGSVEMISPKNVVSLYTASDMYDLKTLKQECTHFMKKNLTVAFFCDAITFAVKHGEKELIERATEFFCDNTLEIVKTAEWQIFLKENTTVGNELLIKLITK